MNHANEQRMTSAGEDMKRQSIQMSEYWEEQLKQMPYLSCKFRVLSECLMVILML